jgi:hypothetical protein
MPREVSLLMQARESSAWDRRVRVLFWIVGLLTGAVLTYTTRFYLNGDGINYIEMGDSLRDGVWSGLVNTTESPGYAFMLGLGHILLGTTVLTELPLLKIVNLVCFVMAMAACDLFVTGVRADVEGLADTKETLLPFAAISALSYSFFLYLALGWVRVRLVAPDMLAFGFSIVAMWFMLRIRRNPDSYVDFWGLGVATGLCYLCKSFFFLFSLFMFALAGSLVGSVRKAVPRIVLAAVAMLLVAAPLLIGLSREVGRFSYGEVGNFGYVNNLAGKGEPIHKPERLHTNPLVELYRSGPGKTYPSGFDLAYWTLGMKPAFDAGIHWKLLVANVKEMLSFSATLLLGTLVWLLYQSRIGRLAWGGLWPPSLIVVLTVLSIPGIAMYCIIHVEHRYLVGFFFFPLVAVSLIPRYKHNNGPARTRALVSTAVVTLLLLAGVAETAIDQSVRGLSTVGNKMSHRDAYAEFFSVSAFLERNGIKAGDEVALVGTEQLPPVYWGRVSGIRITGSIVNEHEFLKCSAQDRKRALAALRGHRIKGVVAKGAYMSALVSEGWQLIPGTTDYYLSVL